MNGAPQAGLTLVETLTALTLLGIVLALLFDGLFVMGRSARVGHAQLAENDRARAVWAFLRREIAEAVPLTARTGAGGHPMFEGTAAELRFFGELPAHRGGGGVHEMRLMRREDEINGSHLVLSYRNAWPEWLAVPAQPADWTTVTLAENVEAVDLAYFGPESDESPGSPSRWHARWAQRATLPRLVKIAVSFDDGARWPELAVRIRVRAPAAQAHYIPVQASTGPAS